jgi:signal transduction histidine kinase
MTAVEELAREQDLQQGFAAFQQAATRLTVAYESLKRRVGELDLELQDRNRRLRDAVAERDTTLARLPVGVVTLDATGAVRSMNAEAQRILDGRQLPPSGFPTQDGDVRLGSEPPLLLRLRNASLPDGGRLLVLEDRSRIEALEREVLRLDRLAALSELAFGIAHEIRNPLTAVAGFAGLLRRSRDPGRVAEWGQRIEDGVRQVDEIVRNLLAFARSGAQELQATTARELVRRACTSLSLPESRVTMAGPALDRSFVTDPVGVRQILVNLLRNAIEAGGVEVPLYVAATATGRALHIQVVDGGPGIPPELVAVVFDPFVTTKAAGTGLGLALCQRVAGCLGGSVRLEGSRPGETRFLLELPLCDEAIDEAIEP